MQLLLFSEITSAVQLTKTNENEGFFANENENEI